MMDEQTLRKEIKTLLWQMGNQREKVAGTLEVLTNELYRELPEDHRRAVVAAIIRNIAYGGRHDL